MSHETLWIGILAATLIIFVLISVVLFIILSTRRERLNLLVKEAGYKARIGEITFSALRSQMNPHFIFNCLNSIKYFTEQNNNETASEYLDKFAGLIRSTLDNARCEKITLQEEISALRKYIELEAMRFKDKLSYNIIVHEDVDIDFVELPPMIVQPYVENAIWHGLMPKENGGMLTVTVSQDDNTAVFIVIHDNGIGRTAAEEMKNRNAPLHKSYGAKITAQRIDMLNENSKSNVAEVKITDEYDLTGNASGTTVTIKLPLK